MFSISNIPINKKKLLVLLLFLGDFLVILSTAILSFRIRTGGYEKAKENWLQIIIILITYLVTLYLFEYYDISLSFTKLRHLVRIISVNTIGIVSVIIFSYVFYLKVIRGVLILWSIIFIILFLLWRYLFYIISRKPMLPENALLVGSDWSIMEIVKEIHKLPITSYNIAGIISDKNGNAQIDGFEGVNIIGNRYNLVD